MRHGSEERGRKDRGQRTESGKIRRGKRVGKRTGCGESLFS